MSSERMAIMTSVTAICWHRVENAWEQSEEERVTRLAGLRTISPFARLDNVNFAVFSVYEVVSSLIGLATSDLLDPLQSSQGLG